VVALLCYAANILGSHKGCPYGTNFYMNPQHKPLIAISSCILGQRVRYDGEIKAFAEIHQHLQQYFELLPVCPEVEIGLSVPRPPVQLTGSILQPRMTGRDDPLLDITDSMHAYCTTKPQQLKNICGYVFKSKSPSCGLKNIPLFLHGKIIANNQRGLFAQAIVERWPDLPVSEETDLQTFDQRQQFIEHTLIYWRKNNF